MPKSRKISAQRLSEAIRSAGFASLRAAAEQCGLKEPTLTSHANGTRGIGLDAAQKYARLFNVSPLWLMGMSDNSEPDTPGIDDLVSLIEGALLSLPPGASMHDMAEEIARVIAADLARRLGENK